MPDSDAPIRAFQDDLTEGASRDRITQAKEHWRVYVQCRTALELRLNKLAIEQDILLSKWRVEDRALRSSRARPVVCVACGARELEHFYRSRESGSTLCSGCFQSRVARGQARETGISLP